jgi:FkbM family methyltransferase
MRFDKEHGRFGIDVVDYIGWALLTRGEFEPLSLKLAVSLMRESREGVFLDVGAHHGLYTVAVGTASGCEVVAVEGSSKNFAILRSNVQLNPKLKARLVNCLASNRESLLQLSLERDGRSAWTKVNTAAETVAGHPFVAGIRLDIILQTLSLSRIHLLKIDVEGYELEVFRGLNWDGPHRPQFVLMECRPTEREKIGFLTDRGYTAKTIDGSDMQAADEYPEGNLLFCQTR